MNRIVLVLVLLAAVFIIGILRKYFTGRGTATADESEAGSEEEFTDFNEDFLNNAAGRTAVPFVRVFAIKDTLMLRSLLAGAGIKTYIENEKVNNLYGGMMIRGYTDSVINIFEDDIRQARPVVEDYIRNLVEDINPEKTVKAVDLAAVSQALPTSLNQVLPEILEPED